MSCTFIIGSVGVCVYKVILDKQQYVIYAPNPKLTRKDSQSLDSLGVVSPRLDASELEDASFHHSPPAGSIPKKDVRLPLDKWIEAVHPPPPVIVVDNVDATTTTLTQCGLDSSRSSRVDTTDCEESGRDTSATDDDLAEYLVCIGPEPYERHFINPPTSTVTCSPRRHTTESDPQWVTSILIQLSGSRYLFAGVHDLFVLECPPSIQENVENVFVDMLLRPWARGKSYLYFLAKKHPFAVPIESTYAQVLLSPQQGDHLLMLSTRPDHAISLVGKGVPCPSVELDGCV